mmetsp:Transcript_34086/g.101269  ORF Transcript_34086/g.101269 Transcript_34086/m.101269 type:complete len:481 (-) Transcript_34086:140-1582(-)
MPAARLRLHALLQRREHTGAHADRANDRQDREDPEESSGSDDDPERGAEKGRAGRAETQGRLRVGNEVRHLRQHHGQQRRRLQSEQPQRAPRAPAQAGAPRDERRELPRRGAEALAEGQEGLEGLPEGGEEAGAGAHGDRGAGEDDHQDRPAPRPRLRGGGRGDHRAADGRRELHPELHDPRAQGGGDLLPVHHPELPRRHGGPPGTHHALREPHRGHRPHLHQRVLRQPEPEHGRLLPLVLVPHGSRGGQAGARLRPRPGLRREDHRADQQVPESRRVPLPPQAPEEIPQLPRAHGLRTALRLGDRRGHRLGVQDRRLVPGAEPEPRGRAGGGDEALRRARPRERRDALAAVPGGPQRVPPHRLRAHLGLPAGVQAPLPRPRRLLGRRRAARQAWWGQKLEAGEIQAAPRHDAAEGRALGRRLRRPRVLHAPGRGHRQDAPPVQRGVPRPLQHGLPELRGGPVGGGRGAPPGSHHASRR